MPTRIILVRHGQSTFNVAKRFQGRTDDSVLTDIGRQTAYQTGLALRSRPLDAVYVSPLQRTQETAQAMLTAIADPTLPVYPHPGLREIDLPEWQGLSYQDVRSRFAHTYRQWQKTPHLLQMRLTQPTAYVAQGRTVTVALVERPQANPVTTFLPLHQLYAQAKGFWQEILAKHRNQTVLVISHGGTIRALISTAIGLDISQYHLLQQSNSGISELVFHQPHQPAQLQSMNLTGHLAELLPKLKNGKQGLRMILLPVSDRATDIHPALTRLQSIPLDFCVTDMSDRAQALATQVLHQHQHAGMHLQINQPNFLFYWHQTLHSKMQDQTGLRTVLVISQLHHIHAFLHHILGLPKSHQALDLKPETLSLLYYPAETQHPVLQAMNLCPDTIETP